MTGDRVAIAIAGDEEATSWTLGERTEDHAAPLNNEVVERVGVGAHDCC